ncbi:MAG TPA: MBOAT family O-acyltransferase [Chitinophagaceae bacterium]
MWLILSIAANIGLLGFFKYYNFFAANINDLSGSALLLHRWVLPIGLSFHTFQSLSYTIEVYRGNQRAERHLGYYALYVMFYPQLVAGPIERPGHLLPQLRARHHFSMQHLYEGLRLMAWGFFKKTVIADRLAEYVDAVFRDTASMNAANIWLGVIFFAIQIYADFSGYCDIALGSARCMGFDLAINFNRPYQALNVREFWRRWHISLSSWFRDYVYIPLGGNRKGLTRKNFNILLTFILSGLWHGAGWTFLIWGFLHGLYVLIYDGFKRVIGSTKRHRVLSWVITAVAICFAWIFFRAPSLADALLVIQKASDLNGFTIDSINQVTTVSVQYGHFTMLFILLVTIYMFGIEKYSNPVLTNLNNRKVADIFIFTTSLLLIIFYGVFHKTSFIYFQF